MDFMTTVFPTGLPVWTTDNDVVYESDAIKLRCFRYGEGVPTLVVPPQAGHSSHIADYDKGQSLVATVMANREGPVYCIEWKACTYERRGESIKDLLEQLDTAVMHTAGHPVQLIGLCQGGWLSAIYASIFPVHVKSLTCVATPIDFHIGGGTIYDTVTSLGMFPYSWIVMMGGGMMRGEMMLAGWKLMHPVERFLGDYIDIYNMDDEGRKKTERFRRWYENTQPLAGTWYLQAVEWLFLNNQLVKGELIVAGSPVNLSNITCPVAMIAGGKDDITLESHLFALSDHVSSKDKYQVTIPGSGHVGCFMGRKSQKYIGDAVRWVDTV